MEIKRTIAWKYLRPKGQGKIRCGEKPPSFTTVPCSAILRVDKQTGGDQMSERKIRAGYYRRYDGKVVYVASLATDVDTGEESVIWTTYPFADAPKYYTSSKSPSALLSR